VFHPACQADAQRLRRVVAQPVWQRPLAVAAHRAVLLLDGEQFGGRLGRRASQREPAVINEEYGYGQARE
jgi:hypothetical protein